MVNISLAFHKSLNVFSALMLKIFIYINYMYLCYISAISQIGGGASYIVRSPAVAFLTESLWSHCTLPLIGDVKDHSINQSTSQKYDAVYMSKT